MPIVIGILAGVIAGGIGFFSLDKALEPDPVAPGQPSTATLLALAVAAGVGVVTVTFFARRFKSARR